MTISNTFSAVKDRLETFFLNPLMGGITGVLAVMAGAIASFYTDEIKANLSIWFLTHTDISKNATMFWVAVFLTGISLSGATWAQRRASNRERSVLQDETASLKDAISRIESLPPEGFLGNYQKLLNRATRSVVAVLSSKRDKGDIEQALRNILGAILELARDYDRVLNANAIYYANIMLYFPKGKTGENPWFKFDGAGPAHPDNEGYLQLIQEFSTSSKQDGFSKDDRIMPLAINIPIKIEPIVIDGGKTKHPVLPGATWAFVYGEFTAFSTIQLLENWLNERCSAAESIKEKAKSYFRSGKGKHIKSFVSMPLLDLSGSDETRYCYGVLNIHSDHEGLLKEKGGDRFSPLMEPFRQLMFILLKLSGRNSGIFTRKIS